MGQFNLQAAMANTAPPPLSNDEKAQWNAFLDFVAKKGLRGSVALDNRDTKLGQKLFDEFKSTNPHFTLTYDKVPLVQQDLQNYRQGLIQKWKANPASAPDVKSADEIMGGISPVDGWFGSKTSSYKYPVAVLTNTDGGVQNFGTNTSAYDAAIAKMKNEK